MKKNHDLLILAVIIAIAALLAWLLRRRQLIPVVTTKILPAPPPPQMEIVSGPMQGPPQLKDIVIGDAIPAWMGLPASCPVGAHVEFDPVAGKNVCVLDGWTLKDLQTA